MRIEVLPHARAVAARAAQLLAAAARAAVSARGRFLFAVSGERELSPMLECLAEESVPWDAVHVFQVDERVAPAGHADRNLTRLREALLARVDLPPHRVHAMPVESRDLRAAADRYARDLEVIGGAPPVLDLVQLGLGVDGHTAALVPGDPVLDVMGSDVAITGAYQGRARMTLTYPALDRAHAILWIVTGAEKAPMLARLWAGDRSIPAGRVRADHATLLTELAAMEGPLA